MGDEKLQVFSRLLSVLREQGQEGRAHIVLRRVRGLSPAGRLCRVPVVEPVQVFPADKIVRPVQGRPVAVIADGCRIGAEFVQHEQIPRLHVVMPAGFPDIGRIGGTGILSVRLPRQAEFRRRDRVILQLMPDLISVFAVVGIREAQPSRARLRQSPVGEPYLPVIVRKGASGKNAAVRRVPSLGGTLVRNQRVRAVPPVDKVRAGHVSPPEAVLAAAVQVHEVIQPVGIEASVGIPRNADVLRIGKVIRGAVRIRKQLFAQLPRRGDLFRNIHGRTSVVRFPFPSSPIIHKNRRSVNRETKTDARRQHLLFRQERMRKMR